MASSNNNPPDPPETASYSKMSVGDVESIGAHCQMPFCRQLDFLPFRCESCKGKFCLDHRTESSHSCPQAGAWARKRIGQQQTSSSRNPSSSSAGRPNILTHEQQCSSPLCKTLINTPLVTGVLCEKCNRSYCLKHRFTYDHDCANLVPLGARPKADSGPTQKEKGKLALEKLRAWGAKKKEEAGTKVQSKSSKQAAADAQALALLKRTAKGDEKLASEKRVYLYVEASNETLTAKIPRGQFFYSGDFSVGRMLDVAAKQLQVANLNNRSESEEDKLRVFHVEGGRLLEFGEKVGKCLQTGNTIVLLRGVGPGMAKTPEKVG